MQRTIQRHALLCLLAIQYASAFVVTPITCTTRSVCASRQPSVALCMSTQQQQQFREEQTRLALIQAQLSLNNQGAAPLQPVELIGQASLPTPSNSSFATDQFRPCLVLSAKSNSNAVSALDTSESLPAVLVPLGTSTSSPAQQLKLLSFAHAGQPLSQSVLLGLTPLLVNRDGALFDNLPWAEWSVDPQQRNRDAANNPILARFHLGKRDAYSRLMLGKDWQGRSASIGNLALRLKYMLDDGDKEAADNDIDITTNEDGGDGMDRLSLAKRILELQLRELEMEVAEWDYQLAIARTSADDKSIEELEQQREATQQQWQDTKAKLTELLEEQQQPPNNDDNGSEPNNQQQPQNGSMLPKLSNILSEIADWTTNYGKNEAPYRGATGYAPRLDTAVDLDKVSLPYTSPYDILKEILEDQLNAEVIGAVLENTSLFEGTLALGGAIILRRLTPTKTVTLVGEQVQVKDDEEDFGNLGASGGQTWMVECDADEAVGMALTYGVPVYLEPGAFQRASVMVAPLVDTTSNIEEGETTANRQRRIRRSLSMWKPLDPELSILREGQAANASRTERASPIRVPRTTSSLFDSMFGPESSSSARPSEMFPTDNPIQSLPQYDELNNQGKAETLLSLSNFNGKLPRPRVVRQSEASPGGKNALDDLLLPLIDESVRRQYLMRDAELRGDTELLEQLRSDVTKRQVAKEKAEEARLKGEDEVAAWWDVEADLYSDLRADVTQDVGSYSRFLDKDEWYERDRRAQAKRVDKKKFGTLLDGIE